MAELKPCPFCGYDAELINGDDYHWVSCPNCGADTMGSEDKEKAIEAWNRRMRDGERICPFDGHMVVCDSDCDRCDYAKMGEV